MMLLMTHEALLSPTAHLLHLDLGVSGPGVTWYWNVLLTLTNHCNTAELY